jgi:predicted RNA-binding Zn ribbon-like protein
MTTSHSYASLPAPLLVGDHLALDLLNTRMMVNGQRCDLLVDDGAAASWLEQVGLPLAQAVDADGRLAEELRALRESIERLVQARLHDQTADPAALNRFLQGAVPQLLWESGKRPVLERFAAPAETQRRLSEIAFSAAQLLSEGDLQRVRKCESHDCSLMFYDRTKAHRRRWCSMALCGNRHKVAEFRKRQQEGGA